MTTQNQTAAERVSAYLEDAFSPTEKFAHLTDIDQSSDGTTLTVADLRALLTENARQQREIARLSAAVCQMCNGHGLIGGFVSAESGYHSEPCPDCEARLKATVQPVAVAQDEREAMLRLAAKAASAGPWSYTGPEHGDGGGQFHNIESPVEMILGEFGPSKENVAFIAAANPAVVLNLLDKLSQARASQTVPTVMASDDLKGINQHHVADAFWKSWEVNGVQHKHGYYESTWIALRAAIRASKEPK